MAKKLDETLIEMTVAALAEKYGVNPRHLLLGTQRDNIRDRHEKGRNGACRGDAAPWSSLTSDQVKTLRERFEAGEKRANLMAFFGISKSQMYRIVKHESWSHI